jgi:protein-S-isoprenylcysteine O-methyltransferase Ste14
MTLATVETFLRWSGGLIACVTLGVIIYGIWRGTQRPIGRTVGPTAGWLRSAAFYALTTALFLAVSVIFWKPLPLTLHPGVHALILVSGALLYFPGMALALWGRLALGKMYFVSTGFGAQLYADHQLVTHGPFAIVRHPMYLGLITAAFGSLLIYQTWTTVLFALFAPFLLLRARREEQALATEFGEQWREYCRRVPALLPHRRKDREYGSDESA